MEDRPTDEWVRDVARLPLEERVARLRGIAEDMDLAERFRLLHELGIYHGEESLSGDGSTLDETASLRAALPDLFRRHDVGSVLDLPCGDFHWMSRVDLGGIDYTGVDVVEEIVERNRRLFGRQGVSFLVLDGTRDPLPRADLILCRDLLVHLSLDAIRRLLRGFVESGSRLLLVTHFHSRTSNPEISSGDFRPINLCAPPFRLPPPLEVISEDSRLGDGDFADRSMALWRISSLEPGLGG